MSQIKVFGHKAPDTDATCSPIVYAWYLKEALEVDTKAYKLGEFNRETAFVLKEFGVETPETLEKLEKGDQVIILDTNNPEELPDNINEAEILEIIDHHKLAGGLSTDAPLTVTISPVACTATLVYETIAGDEELEIPREMAGLLLASIISDTLKFTSPTTTELDKEVAEELVEVSGIAIDELAEKMFAAKSDLTGMTSKDVLLSDSKVFQMAGKKVRVAVLETTKPENALEMAAELKNAMLEMKNEEGLDQMYFFVVDILNSEAKLLVSTEGEKEIAAKAFAQEFSEEYLTLPGVVSRKKQMVPNLEKAQAGV